MNSKEDSEPPLAAVPEHSREFFFPGSQVSALLIHGLTGTPYEMRYLGERLAASGFRVLGIKLAGHGATPEALGATSHAQWYESVVDGYERLRRFRDPIAVVGQSMGAVLAARLAIDQRDAISGVVLLAPALFLPPWQRVTLHALSKLATLASRFYFRTGSPDIHDAAARQIHPQMGLMPLAAALSLCELSALVRPKLIRLVQPTLVIHSRNDHTCPFRKNTEFLMNNLGSAKRRLVALSESYHVISVDTEKDRVANETIEMLRELTPQTHAARAAS